MFDISIEICEKSDLRKLAEVFFYSFRGKLPDQEQANASVKQFGQLTENDLATFYTVKEASEIIGLGAITKHKGSSYIGYMGIIPPKRKQGLGSKLFDKLVVDALTFYPTIELFANLGPDRIYRKYGFVDQFKAFRVELSTPQGIELEYDLQVSEKIPQWIYQFDKEAMGYDRSVFLNYLINKEDSSVVYFEEKGKECYAIKNGQLIGPVIAKTDEIASQLICKLYLLNARHMIISERIFSKLEGKYRPIKQQECIKMIYGPPIKDRSDWVWGYNSFAHG